MATAVPPYAGGINPAIVENTERAAYVALLAGGEGEVSSLQIGGQERKGRERKRERDLQGISF